MVDTKQISEGNYSIEVLPGGHLPGHKVDILMVLKGMFNAEGFLSAIGITDVDKEARQNNIYCINSIPCNVLMSIGTGFCDSFTQHTNNATYFVSWALPCSD